MASSSASSSITAIETKTITTATTVPVPDEERSEGSTSMGKVTDHIVREHEHGDDDNKEDQTDHEGEEDSDADIVVVEENHNSISHGYCMTQQQLQIDSKQNDHRKNDEYYEYTQKLERTNKSLVQERDQARIEAREYEEQIGAVFDVINLLSKLTVMDPASHDATNTARSDGCDRSEGGNYEGCSSPDATAIANNSSSKEYLPPALPDLETSSADGYDQDQSHSCQLSPNANISNENSAITQSHSQSSSCISISNITNTSIQSQLEQLQQNWKLEETPLPNLIACIHQIQSHLLHAQTEADASIPQIQHLNENLLKYKSRNLKLERTVKKLYKENVQLKRDLKLTRKESKNVVKTVKTFVKKKREEELAKEELHVATRLTVHEKMLQMSTNNTACSGSTTGSSSTSFRNNGTATCAMNTTNGIIMPTTPTNNRNEISCHHLGQLPEDDPLVGNRIRTCTAESTLSELDPLFDASLPVHYDHAPPFLESGVGVGGGGYHGGDDPYLQSGDIDRMLKYGDNGGNAAVDDGASCYSVNSNFSVRSLVTEECSATVRIDPNYSKSPSSSILPAVGSTSSLPAHLLNDTEENTVHHQYHRQHQRPQNQYYHEEKKVAIPSYTLTFPKGEDVGLQFMPLILDVNHEHTNSSSSQAYSKHRDRSFSDSAMMSDIPKAKSHVQISPRPPKHTSAVKFDFERKLSSFSSEDSDCRDSPISTPQSHSTSSAFLVYDFEGFDTTLNVRPTVGARLVAIGDLSLTDQSRLHWNLDDVMQALEDIVSSSPSDASGSFTLTFQNVSLTKSQKAALKKPSGTRARAKTNPNDSLKQGGRFFDQFKRSKSIKSEKKTSFFTLGSSKKKIMGAGASSSGLPIINSDHDKKHESSFFGILNGTSKKKERDQSVNEKIGGRYSPSMESEEGISEVRCTKEKSNKKISVDTTCDNPNISTTNLAQKNGSNGDNKVHPEPTFFNMLGKSPRQKTGEIVSPRTEGDHSEAQTAIEDSDLLRGEVKEVSEEDSNKKKSEEETCFGSKGSKANDENKKTKSESTFFGMLGKSSKKKAEETASLKLENDLSENEKIIEDSDSLEDKNENGACDDSITSNDDSDVNCVTKNEPNFFGMLGKSSKKKKNKKVAGNPAANKESDQTKVEEMMECSHSLKVTENEISEEKHNKKKSEGNSCDDSKSPKPAAATDVDCKSKSEASFFGMLGKKKKEENITVTKDGPNLKEEEDKKNANNDFKVPMTVATSTSLIDSTNEIGNKQHRENQSKANATSSTSLKDKNAHPTDPTSLAPKPLTPNFTSHKKKSKQQENNEIDHTIFSIAKELESSNNSNTIVPLSSSTTTEDDITATPHVSKMTTNIKKNVIMSATTTTSTTTSTPTTTKSSNSSSTKKENKPSNHQTMAFDFIKFF